MTQAKTKAACSSVQVEAPVRPRNQSMGQAFSRPRNQEPNMTTITYEVRTKSHTITFFGRGSKQAAMAHARRVYGDVYRCVKGRYWESGLIHKHDLRYIQPGA